MSTREQPAQTADSPIVITSDSLKGGSIRCTSAQWVEHGDWLADEGVKKVAITTPFIVTPYGGSGRRWFYALEPVCPPDEEWEEVGVWLDLGGFDWNVAAVQQILAKRWPRITFQLPTPAGVPS